MIWAWLALYTWDFSRCMVAGAPEIRDCPRWLAWAGFIAVSMLTSLFWPLVRLWRWSVIVTLWVELQVVRRAIRRCRGRK